MFNRFQSLLPFEFYLMNIVLKIHSITKKNFLFEGNNFYSDLENNLDAIYSKGTTH